MNTEETGKILAYITAVEANRDFGEFEFKVWHDLLKDLHYEDAIEGVRKYFKSGNMYPIKPGNIIDGSLMARAKRHDRQNGLARARIVELGGQAPTYWNGEPFSSTELAHIGALIETNDPRADDAVRQIIAAQQKRQAELEEGERWVREHGHELGVTLKEIG